MSKPPFDIARAVSAHADSPPTLPLRELRDQFLLRWPLLVVCLVVMPIVAAGLTSLVPATFKSSAQLLIRHESSSLRVLDATGRRNTDASGPASAELLRSVPVISRMVAEVDAEETDVARPAYKAVLRHALRLLAPLLPKNNEAGSPDPALARALLANEFKPSIKVTNLQTEPGGFGRQDELLEVTFTSTNPVKVAAMTNALCSAFIQEHNLRSEAEAARTAEILAELESGIRAQIQALNGLQTPAARQAEAVQSRPAERPQPLTESLARHLADQEMALIETRRAYGENSAELRKAEHTRQQTRAVLTRQETLDGLNAVLTTLLDKQRETAINLALARKNQTGLSIAEPGLPPRVTSLVKVMRYAVPVGTSLFLGGVLGLGLVVAATTLEGKVRSRWDVERLTGGPITGLLSPTHSKVSPSHSAPRAPVMDKLLSAMESSGARVVVVISPHGTERVFGLSLALAEALAANPRNRVLLVDGNLAHPVLTEVLDQSGAHGLAELLSEPAQPHANLAVSGFGRFVFLPAGQAGAVEQLALLKGPWGRVLAELKLQADFIIIDAGGLELGRATRALLQTADGYLLGIVNEVTELAAVESAVRELAPLRERSLGTVLIAPNLTT